jgi:hypothetical protein
MLVGFAVIVRFVAGTTVTVEVALILPPLPAPVSV